MKIKSINALRGPNYWSVHRHKLILMVLDLEEMEDYPSHKIDGFSARLKEMLPSLYSHHCSEDDEGGFFYRVDKGTWMGHVIEHIALEIQTLAGMETGFGRTRGYGEDGVYNVVFSYVEESVGRYAAQAAVKICEALIVGKVYDLKADLQEMRELREVDRLGPSTESIIEEAESRGIPWLRLNKNSLCQLGYGANQKRIQATITSETSNIGVDLACDKEDTKHLLEQAKVEIAKGELITSENDLERACETIGFPLVIKPIGGNHGRGITVNINSQTEALVAFKMAKKVSYKLIVEKYITGDDYRLLVINHSMIAAAKRTPAHVVGDGKSTIKKLVDQVNKNPNRGYGHEKMLTRISINDLTKSILKTKGYTKNSVPSRGEKVLLKDTANLSTGGTSEDVTQIVHPSNIEMAERISKIIDLDICGIDVITKNITKPLSETGGVVLEVNAAPGFRMHLFPTVGLPRNVAEPVIDKLFPERFNTGRIPIVAVTGSNGKTTTTRLIAHMAKMTGCRVGYTTTEGVYVQNRLMMSGDCTGPASAEFVLKDPTVNFAVLECARGGILRSGLGFDKCDIGIVTNVTEDHLGLKGIQTLEQLAKVKKVIPETVQRDGYAILNADDDLVFQMGEDLYCHLALFSMNENNPRIKKFQKTGGITAIYENGFVTLCQGPWKMRVMKTTDIPLTYGGKVDFMIENILPALITGKIQGMSIADMRAALETFLPSISQTPGRLNMFQFEDFRFLLDYAHNPTGMRALQKFTDKLDAAVKVGIIAGIGDRRNEDTIEIGKIAAEMFDEIIIRLDKDLRGKNEKEIIKMLEEGIKSVDSNKKTTLIPIEKDAILFAVNNATIGSLIVLCSDEVIASGALIQKLKENETMNLFSTG